MCLSAHGAFSSLSNINEALDAGRRPQYTADVLLSCFSPTTLQTVLSMGLTEDELKNHETILKKLKERCKSGRNQHVWRHEFNNKRQLPNQSFDDYLCELRDIAAKCAYKDDCCDRCLPARLLDRIVAGVENDDLRRKLIEKAAGLTLEDAIIIAQAWEANKSVSGLSSSETYTVDAVR